MAGDPNRESIVAILRYKNNNIFEAWRDLNHESCWKKVIFMLTANRIASIDSTVIARK
jgi:hypothetical protein